MSTEQTFTSPVSGKPAELIGWVESNDINKGKEIDKILASFKKTRLTLPETNIAKQANAEGGNEVSENTETVAVTETAPVEVSGLKLEILEIELKNVLQILPIILGRLEIQKVRVGPPLNY